MNTSFPIMTTSLLLLLVGCKEGVPSADVKQSIHEQFVYIKNERSNRNMAISIQLDEIRKEVGDNDYVLSRLDMIEFQLQESDKMEDAHVQGIYNLLYLE